MSTSNIWAPVIAGAVGGVLSLLGAFFQRRWDLRQTTRRERSTQASEIPARCDARLRALGRELIYQYSEQRREAPWRHRTATALKEIELDSALLGDPYRERVQVSLNTLRNAQAIAQFHWQQPTTIAYTAQAELHAVLAAAMRGESPPPRQPLMVEYEYADREFDEVQADVYAESTDKSEQAHQKYLENNPTLAASIESKSAAEHGAKRRFSWLHR